MKRTTRGGARPIRRRALVNLILCIVWRRRVGSCCVMASIGDSCVDLVLVTICEAGRKEEERRRRRNGPAEWAITRRPRIRCAGPRRRTRRQSPAYSRRPSSGPSISPVNCDPSNTYRGALGYSRAGRAVAFPSRAVVGLRLRRRARPRRLKRRRGGPETRLPNISALGIHRDTAA